MRSRFYRSTSAHITTRVYHPAQDAKIHFLTLSTQLKYRNLAHDRQGCEHGDCLCRAYCCTSDFNSWEKKKQIGTLQSPGMLTSRERYTNRFGKMSRPCEGEYISAGVAIRTDFSDDPSCSSLMLASSARASSSALNRPPPTTARVRHGLPAPPLENLHARTNDGVHTGDIIRLSKSILEHDKRARAKRA